jgi:hypothetical protein
MAYQGAARQREVYSDFNDYERLPDGSVRVALGPQSLLKTLEPLADPQDGEAVMVVLPGELEAAGTLVREPLEQGIFWYAVLPSWEAIHNIYPETVADHDQVNELRLRSTPTS